MNGVKFFLNKYETGFSEIIVRVFTLANNQGPFHHISIALVKVNNHILIVLIATQTNTILKQIKVIKGVINLYNNIIINQHNLT